jgi:hypothetical protein
MINPREAISRTEILVFGNTTRHPITGEPLEMGSGALSPRDQAYNVHLKTIAERDGKAAAAEMRKKIEDADKFAAAQTSMAAAKSTLASDGVSVTAAEKVS